jgi:hypothetical protein
MASHVSHPDDADEWLADVIATPGGHRDAGDRTGPRVTTFGDALDELIADLKRGEPPVVWTPEDRPWGALALQSGDVQVVGAASANGKTSFALNLLDRMLERYPDLRVLVASNDMSTRKMTQRLFSMRSGIPYQAIRKHDVSQYSLADLERVQAEVASFRPRLRNLERPFTVEEVHESALDFRANIVFVDFLQATDLAAGSRDAQQRVAATMRALRALADAGPCVITTAALSRAGIERAQSRVGRNDADALDMGVFLHASEIEYVADLACLLLAEPGAKVAVGTGDADEPVSMWLQCVKARDSAKTITPLLFDGRIQKFTLRDIAPSAAKSDTKGRRTSKGGKNETSRGESGEKGYPSDGGTMWLS